MRKYEREKKYKQTEKQLNYALDNKYMQVNKRIAIFCNAASNIENIAKMRLSRQYISSRLSSDIQKAIRQTKKYIVECKQKGNIRNEEIAKAYLVRILAENKDSIRQAARRRRRITTILWSAYKSQQKPMPSLIVVGTGSSPDEDTKIRIKWLNENMHISKNNRIKYDFGKIVDYSK